MAGYDENFLGRSVTLPLPTLRAAQGGTILYNGALREGFIADYDNYSVVTDPKHRAPLYAAANINIDLFKNTHRISLWQIDQKVGPAYQLNNDYYKNNDWDKGHQAMRESAGWGQTPSIAQHGSDATFFYSNAALQHKNLNQDEWLALETWVNHLNGKVTCFTGPIFGQHSRIVEPAGRPAAEVPAAFFKVVCFLNEKSKKLDVRAFIIYQDDEAIRDKDGRKTFNYQRYQVTVKEIENLTGLEFIDEIYERNPLLFTENPAKAEKLGITSFPERVEVDRKNEIIDHNQPRVRYEDDNVGVYLSAARIGKAPWVSILNLENRTVRLKGWSLQDLKGTAVACPDEKLAPGEAYSMTALGKLQFPKDGGFIELYRGKDRIDRVAYTEKDAKKAGRKPIVFAYRTEW